MQQLKSQTQSILINLYTLYRYFSKTKLPKVYLNKLCRASKKVFLDPSPSILIH